MLKARGNQRTDSTHVLAVVRGINRLECVLETMRNALNAIAELSPEWLHQLFQTTLLERYSPRAINVRIPHSAIGRQEFAESVGRDVHALLDVVYNWSDLPANREINAIETLRRVVIQQFYVDERGVHWRTSAEGIPPSLIFINSPYDLDAHYEKKRQFQWTGYKVSLTETCDDELPRIITNVETQSNQTGNTNIKNSPAVSKVSQTPKFATGVGNPSAHSKKWITASKISKIEV